MTNTLALRPGWTPLTIGLMVLGFIVFWPLGFAMLAYILWGDRFHKMASDATESFKANGWGCSAAKSMRSTGFGATGNVAFDAYRKREFERLEEERRKLDQMRADFDSFLAELRMAKDKEEFDRFMSDRDRRNREGDAA
jgi:hypothetical protein